MRSREGVTLIEVLAAIFIMGIGMLAILVLFPLGALAIARALKDDRCANIAPNAHAFASAMKLGNDDNDKVSPLIPLTDPNSKLYKPFTWDPLQEGYPEVINPLPADQAAPSHSNWPSYSVFVDPYYHQRMTSGYEPNWLVTSPKRTVARVRPNYIRNYPAAALSQLDATEMYFAFRDDLTFRPNGYPKAERQGLYTWAYMLRRLHSNNRNSLEMQVVVYSGRPIEVPAAEVTYGLVAARPAGVTDFVLTWTATQERPALKRGNWLFDSSYQVKAVGTPPVSHGYVNGCFYRVMDVTDAGSNQFQVEVQPPLRVMQTGDQVTQMTLLPGAVEVFERGNLRD